MKSIIPNSITLLNLISGCMAICFAFKCTDVTAGYPGYLWAFLFVIIAAVADFCDGLSARLIGAYSELGKQLDSLSDTVSFGVAPAMILFNLFAACSAPAWASYICLLIPVCGALRLARFNISDRPDSSFSGMPIPGCALFCIGLASMMTTGVNLYAATGCVVAIALLMVAPIEMYSLKFHNLGLRENFARYLLIVIAVACIVLWGWEGLFYLIAYYAISALFLNLWNATRQKS